MKKVICVFAMLVMVGVLCAGCKDAGKTTPETTKQSNESEDKNWQPEMASPTAMDCDHAGHHHGPGGHDHGPAASQPATVDDHAGHDHGPGEHDHD